MENIEKDLEEMKFRRQRQKEVDKEEWTSKGVRVTSNREEST